MCAFVYKIKFTTKTFFLKLTFNLGSVAHFGVDCVAHFGVDLLLGELAAEEFNHAVHYVVPLHNSGEGEEKHGQTAKLLDVRHQVLVAERLLHGFPLLAVSTSRAVRLDVQRKRGGALRGVTLKVLVVKPDVPALLFRHRDLGSHNFLCTQALLLFLLLTMGNDPLFNAVPHNYDPLFDAVSYWEVWHTSGVDLLLGSVAHLGLDLGPGSVAIFGVNLLLGSVTHFGVDLLLGSVAHFGGGLAFGKCGTLRC